MNVAEKRRGSNGSHVLRTGPGHATRQNLAASHQSAGGDATPSSSCMPAPPLPARAAVPGSNDKTAGGSQDANDGRERGSGAAPPPGGEEKDRDAANTPRGGGGPSRRTAKDQGRDRAAALLGEKDDRVACLERELATLRRDHARQLDALRREETDTAAFWQAKHSALHQQFLRTDTELRVLRSEAEGREAERGELRRGRDLLRREVAERKDEIHVLRRQVRDMKRFVSTSTRTDGQTSDEVFGEGVARLGNGLQNWVISHFRRARLAGFDAVDEATLAELGELAPVYEHLARGAKVHLLQSIVARILVDMVFGIYFLGLSEEQLRHFRQMEGTLSQLALSEASVNQWRASTLALLQRDAPQLLRDETGRHVEKVTVRINRILDSITTEGNGTASAPGSARDASLRTLVTSSVELARLLVAQKAVLRMHMPEMLPHQRVLFDGDTMEDVGGEDEDEEGLARREIWCVVFPGLVKHGDENGGQMQFRNVIAKARVLCRPGE